MGQKVNPTGFRVGIKGGLAWPTRWFSRKAYGETVLEDIKIRSFLEKEYAHTKCAKIEIERSGDHVRIILHSAMPGLLIGKKGQDIEALRRRISKLLKRQNVEVSVQEVKNPLLSAQVVAQGIADQLVRRSSFKRAIKKAAADMMRAGAQGVKICVAGRLDGAEIARSEWIRAGSVPLHTLRKDIDYGFAEALTTYGKIGVKVWVCRGDYSQSHNA